MIARGFKSMLWVGAVGGAALGCYMISLNVASERAELASLDRQIVLAKRDIRTLQTELGTRGRLQQLEQWNAEVLALSAPASGQFVEDEFRLASYTPQEKSFQESAKVQLASAEAVPQQPKPAVARGFEPQPAAPQLGGAVVHRASLVVSEPPAPARVPELKKITPRPAASPLVKVAAAGVPAKPLVKVAAEGAVKPKVKAIAPAKAEVIKAGIVRPLVAKPPVKKASLASDSLVKELAEAAKAEKKSGDNGRR